MSPRLLTTPRPPARGPDQPRRCAPWQAGATMQVCAASGRSVSLWQLVRRVGHLNHGARWSGCWPPAQVQACNTSGKACLQHNPHSSATQQSDSATLRTRKGKGAGSTLIGGVPSHSTPTSRAGFSRLWAGLSSGCRPKKVGALGANRKSAFKSLSPLNKSAPKPSGGRSFLSGGTGGSRCRERPLTSGGLLVWCLVSASQRLL